MRAALILLLATIAACGTVTSTTYPIETAQDVAFRFDDERPEEQRKSRSTGGGYAGTTNHLGDDRLKPAAPELFKAWLSRSRSLGSGSRVVLEQFEVSVYEPPIPSNAGIQAAFGLVGALVEYGVQNARTAKTVHVRVQGRIDDEHFSSLASGTFKGTVTEDNINAVIRDALEKALAGIRPG